MKIELSFDSSKYVKLLAIADKYKFERVKDLIQRTLDDLIHDEEQNDQINAIYDM